MVMICVLLYFAIGLVFSLLIMKIGDVKKALSIEDEADGEDYMYAGFLFIALASIWPILVIVILIAWLAKKVGKEIMKLL